MIQIIKHGRYNSVECSCGCSFSFDSTDVVEGSVMCPECFTLNAVDPAPSRPLENEVTVPSYDSLTDK